jgi:very-short-patch-repair endonuclease
MLPYARYLKPIARSLRSAQTEAEAALWREVRRKRVHGVQFYRQKPLGPFVVDFYCPAAKLVIEVDGRQHFAEQGLASDAERDAYLAGLGLEVMRFSNDDVLSNTAEVVAKIGRMVGRKSDSPL